MMRPVDPVLFTGAEPLELAGNRCRRCDTVQFPAAAQCAHCAAPDPTTMALPRQGTLWTWTVQRFAPNPPYRAPAEGFIPFAVGYVDLGEVLVESVLAMDIEAVAVGLPVHLVALPLPGVSELYTYGFAA